MGDVRGIDISKFEILSTWLCRNILLQESYKHKINYTILIMLQECLEDFTFCTCNKSEKFKQSLSHNAIKSAMCARLCAI